MKNTHFTLHATLSTLFFVLCTLLLAGCKEKLQVNHYEVEAPEIYDFTPAEGFAGTQVTINGAHLGRVDSAWIGGVLTPLRYRVSDTKIVIEVAAAAKTGAITLSNIAGAATTVDTFTVTYLTPAVGQWPDTGIVYQQIVLEGENLNVVDRVLLDDMEATIIARRPEELVFEVPFRDDESPVAIRLTYYTAEGEQQVGPEGKTFVIEKQQPVITSYPTSLTKYEPVTIEGELLSLFDSLKVGEERVQILSKNDEMITIDMPTNYFGGPMTADLVGYYYGTKTRVICPNFEVISDPNEPRYYTYKNVVLSGRSQSGGADMPFFSGETGSVFSTCEAEGQMMAIDFLLYDNTGYAQLYSPSNATNTLKNFKCEGASIVTDASVWAPFFAVDTKFRVLDPANATQKAVIDAYEAGTIVSLSEILVGVSDPSSKAPKVYESNSSNTNLSVDNYPYAYVRNFNTGKNGIMKILGVKADETSGKTYEVTMDIIWEK